jgi:hypothetical protein
LAASVSPHPDLESPDDGQCAHTRHAQIARRANLPQGCAACAVGQITAAFRPSRLAMMEYCS